MSGGAVWVFDGEDGRSEIMSALVLRQVEALEQLLPEEFDDPMEQLAAELNGDAEGIVAANPVLARLFPPALVDAEESARFRRDALVQQANSRLVAARAVLRDISLHGEAAVPVMADGVDAWVMTLAGLRAQWTVELTGSEDRLAEATFRDTMRNPTAAAVTDWLGHLIEDALESRLRGAGDR